ncbi:hypothetical protein Tco_0362659 [Tanacetum coccineum]
MSSPKFAEMHNVVAFLEKPVESDGFAEIIDFLKASSVHYALTVNPIIYTSCIEQFWATENVNMVNEVCQLQALIDKKKMVITESSIRSDLHLKDAEARRMNHINYSMGSAQRSIHTGKRMKIIDVDADDKHLLNETKKADEYLKFDTGVLECYPTAGLKIVLFNNFLTTVEKLWLRLVIKSRQPNPRKNTQARIEADRLTGLELQTREREELTDEEKGKLFMELMEKRRKHFAALRVQEKRNKPPTKAQKRSQISTYLKHMEAQESNEKKVEGSEEKSKSSRKKSLGKKRAVKEQKQESPKRQKLEDDKETDEQEEVEADDTAELKKHLDESSKRYSSMIRMLQDIDKEDLETIWKLVKIKQGDTSPEDETLKIVVRERDFKVCLNQHLEVEV